MASTLKKYTDEYDKINKSALDSQIATVKRTAEKNRNIVNQNYGAKISETEQSYDDQERINAVQKLINEQEIAENMANLGLTDSGLNRTQQTAVQLSYANNRANIERQKRSAIDGLTREMNAYLTEIETGAESSIAGLKDTYNQNRTSYAQSMYKTDVDAAAKAEAARIKAEQEAASLNHGLNNSQINKFMSYISSKDYSSAVKYLDIYGNSLDDVNLKYWMSMIPENYINADSIILQYGDANEDNKYDILDFIRTKKASKAKGEKNYVSN